MKKLSLFAALALISLPSLGFADALGQLQSAAGSSSGADLTFDNDRTSGSDSSAVSSSGSGSSSSGSGSSASSGGQTGSPNAAPPSPNGQPARPGFLQRMMNPKLAAPVGLAAAAGAAGFMTAGPIGALVGAAIGGLFGFLIGQVFGRS